MRVNRLFSRHALKSDVELRFCYDFLRRVFRIFGDAEQERVRKKLKDLLVQGCVVPLKSSHEAKLHPEEAILAKLCRVQDYRRVCGSSLAIAWTPRLGLCPFSSVYTKWMNIWLRCSLKTATIVMKGGLEVGSESKIYPEALKVKCTRRQISCVRLRGIGWIYIATQCTQAHRSVHVCLLTLLACIQPVRVPKRGASLWTATLSPWLCLGSWRLRILC